MIPFIYDIGIRLYALAIRIASPFNGKAKEWVSGRQSLWKQLPDVSGKKVIWFHCASLGEFDQGLPVMNAMRLRHPEAFFLVTFFSPSGYLHYHKRKHPVDFACYMPLDTRANAKRFVAHFNPEMTFFVKYEFWSKHIFELKQAGSQLFSISTLLRPNHRFFQWYGAYFRRTLNQFDYFFVQNERTLGLLASIGIENALVSGDTRFDRVIENKEQLQPNPILTTFTGNAERILIAGSTWPADEDLLLPAIREGVFDKVIIAPHAIDEKHIAEICSKLTVPYIRYSQVEAGETQVAAPVLILDTIGHLASAYFYGHLAYVGGGFSGSLHNILEPAVFGLPVIFGPKHHRFPEAEAFLERGIGFSISDTPAFQKAALEILNNRRNLSQQCTNFVEENRGAAAKIVEAISAN